MNEARELQPGLPARGRLPARGWLSASQAACAAGCSRGSSSRGTACSRGQPCVLKRRRERERRIGKRGCLGWVLVQRKLVALGRQIGGLLGTSAWMAAGLAGCCGCAGAWCVSAGQVCKQESVMVLCGVQERRERAGQGREVGTCLVRNLAACGEWTCERGHGRTCRAGHEGTGVSSRQVRANEQLPSWGIPGLDVRNSLLGRQGRAGRVLGCRGADPRAARPACTSNFARLVRELRVSDSGV